MFEIEYYLAIFFVFMFLIMFFFLFKFLPISNFFKRAEIVAKNLFQIDFILTRNLNPISLIILFYMIYFMIFKSVLVNNIKSNSVVVDTSEIVNSKEDILKTKKQIFFKQMLFLILNHYFFQINMFLERRSRI